MDLAIRVGLNSGPTTAGVLRGDKARFQLFGDVSCVSIVEIFNFIVFDHLLMLNHNVVTCILFEK